MTGDGDRLDGIVRRWENRGAAAISPGEVSWLIGTLRDARAENERINGSRSCYVAAGLALERERDELRAELAAERAKVERVRALRAEWAQHSAEDRNHELWRALGVALAGGEQ